MAIFEQNKFPGGAEYSAFSGPLQVKIWRFNDPEREDHMVVWDLASGQKVAEVPLRKVEPRELEYHYG